MKLPLYISCLSLLLIGCARLEHDIELFDESISTEILDQIQKDSGILLPPDSHGLNYYYKGAIDPVYAVKIEIPSQARENIIEQVSKIKHKGTSISNALGTQFNWWIDAQSEILIDRQTDTGNSYLIVILAEKDGRLFLYIEYAVI